MALRGRGHRGRRPFKGQRGSLAHVNTLGISLGEGLGLEALAGVDLVTIPLEIMYRSQVRG